VRRRTLTDLDTYTMQSGQVGGSGRLDLRGSADRSIEASDATDHRWHIQTTKISRDSPTDAQSVLTVIIIKVPDNRRLRGP
jgi:hypothetical protein